MRLKTEARRQLILQEAAKAFQSVGYEKTSMSEIALRVGGSKATLYNYFPSKEVLFVAVMDFVCRDAFEAAFALLTHERPLKDVLEDLGVHYLQTLMRPELVATRRMAENEGDASEVGRLLYENGPKRGWTLVSGFLQESMARGQLPQTDPWIAALHLKALYEAEHTEQRLLGVITEVSEADLRAAVARGLAVWSRAYGVA
jgi:AcrR family transcriptional regulator